MAVREVLRYPHPALKRAARELGPGDEPEIERVARDLVDTMRAHPRCVGVAAPQLDELVRMVVVDVTDHPKAVSCNGLLVLVNPLVARADGGEVGREGCLSIPDLTANVRRATDVTIEAADPAGNRVAIDADAFEARCLLQETAPPDGILSPAGGAPRKPAVSRRKRY